MGTVTGFTAERMLEIENETIVDGGVDGSGHLILISRGGTSIDAGYVVGPKGDKPNDAADITQGVFDLNRIPVMTNSKMPVPVTIPSNTSLNTYQTTGFYYQTTLAFATLALAYPLAGVGGLLRVTRFDSGNYVYQEWFSTDGKNNFVRSLSGITWSGWVRVALEGNTVSFAHLTLPGDGRLRLPNTNDASISSTLHAFQIGSDNGTNLRIDNNEIQGVNNGAVSPLYIQNDGGDATLGTSTSKITVPGLLTNTLTDIAASVNLNTMITPGRYIQPLTANATLALNYPIASAGMLEVEASTSGNMVFQRFTRYHPDNPIIFERTWYQNVWGRWITVAWDSDWITSGITAAGVASSVGTQKYRRYGDVVSFILNTIAITTGVSVPTSGDMTNSVVAQMPSGYWPSTDQALQTYGSGRVAAFYINPSGQILISAIAPDATWTATQSAWTGTVSCGGSYLLN